MTTAVDRAGQEAAKGAKDALPDGADGSQEGFRALFEEASAGILIASPDSRFIDANPAACRLLGYSRDELLGMTTADLVRPEDQGHLIKAREELRAGKTLLGTWLLVRGDGSLAEASVSTRILEDGRVVAFLNGDHQVDELTAERELALRRVVTVEHRYLTLLEHAPDAILVSGLDGYYREVNRAAERLLGYTREELQTMRAADLVVPEQHERLGRVVRDLVSGETALPPLREWTLRRKDGTIVEVEVSATIFPDGRWQSFLRDISARKALEREREEAFEALRESERRYEDMVREASDAIVVADESGRFTEANEAACRMLGYSREEMLELTVSDVIKPEEIPSMLRARDRVLAGETFRGERTMVRRDGTELATEVTSKVIETGRWQAIIRDSTERRRVEDAQREFIANASHELRTPLAGILGAAEALRTGAADSPDRRSRFLDGIIRETERLGRLTTVLLLLARAQSGSPDPAVENVEVGPLLDSVAMQLDLRPGVAISVKAPPGLAVAANPTLLDAALRNLGHNAAAHTEKGRVELRASEEHDGTVLIEVADTGAGIAPDVLSHVFERFYREHQAGPGFGLGLPLVRQIIEAQGGTIEIASATSEGSRVSVRLPGAIR